MNTEDEYDFCNAWEKAQNDPFYYAVGLTTGQIIVFHQMTVIDDTWVHLSDLDIRDLEGDVERTFPFKVERGVDVKIEHIIWIMDAPGGS